MVLTESEAKTKRCCGPEGCGVPNLTAEERKILQGGGSAIFLTRMCIGSLCMAWRDLEVLGHGRDPDGRGFCGYSGG